MNLLDHWVTEVCSKPYFDYDKWWVDVEYICEGTYGRSSLMFNTYEESLTVDIGDTFLA